MDVQAKEEHCSNVGVQRQVMEWALKASEGKQDNPCLDSREMCFNAFLASCAVLSGKEVRVIVYCLYTWVSRLTWDVCSTQPEQLKQHRRP